MKTKTELYKDLWKYVKLASPQLRVYALQSFLEQCTEGLTKLWFFALPKNPKEGNDFWGAIALRHFSRAERIAEKNNWWAPKPKKTFWEKVKAFKICIHL